MKENEYTKGFFDGVCIGLCISIITISIIKLLILKS